MDFITKRKQQLGINSLGDLKRSGRVTGDAYNPSLFVHGPKQFDCNHYQWSRQECCGIVADSGTGKTEFVLYCFKEILKNNPDSSAIFVSLEMTDEKVAGRWFKITEDSPELADRLFIISRYNDDGTSNEISMRWIKKELTKYKSVVGDIITFAIDHLHVIGENDTSSLNSICASVKEMCVEMNAWGILLAQVSKTAGQKGEVPLSTDSVYGCSQFKWIMSDAIQLHRPIKRFERDAGISVLGWGYCKVREPHENDKMFEGQNDLLKYDIKTRSFISMTNTDFTIFKSYYNDLLEIKMAEEKSKAYMYNITKEVKTKDGKIMTIKEKFTGDVQDL